MNSCEMVATKYRLPTIVSRFWPKVAIKDDCDCWVWTGNSLKGRGLFKVGLKNEYAPRIAWVLEIGDIPEGYCVLHKCDNPGCVNPAHLFLGTKGENNADRNAKGRQAKGERNNSKLTKCDAILIKRLITDGKSLRSIEALGYSYTAIVDIKRGRTWRDTN